MLNNDLSVKIYQTISDNNKPRDFKHWHASSIADCPRAHFFKRLAIPAITQPSAAKILRWQGGHAMETAIRQHLNTLYKNVISNKRLTSKELDLTGEYDNLADNHTLVEIKTVHDYAFIEKNGVTKLKEKIGFTTDGRNRWGVKDEPYLNHILQQHAYVLLLKEKGVEITNIDYVYISLSGRVVVYSTEVEDKYLNNVKNRLEVLNKAWETKTPPECICVSSHPLYDSVMQWCDYKTDKECCSLDLLKMDNRSK